MAYKKIADLVVKLYDKTVQGEIPWEATDKEGVFQKSFSNYSVRISASQTTMIVETSSVVILSPSLIHQVP